MATSAPQPAESAPSILSAMLDRIRETANVRVVYGEPTTVGDTSVIPVAAIAYAFGAGGGSGYGTSQDTSGSGGGNGGGGGGAVRVQPFAYLEVTSQGTRVRPVIDWTRIATGLISLVGIWLKLRARRAGS